MGLSLYINVLGQETRVALMEERKLIEYAIERIHHKQIAGNVYLGKVENVLPGMQAAFVDIGTGKNAFLYIDDLFISHSKQPADTYKQQAPTIQALLKKGDRLLVQVSKVPAGGKGARLTTNISLPGRYLVFAPHSEHIGISRRLLDEAEKARLKFWAEGVVKDREGLIIRTVCEGVAEEKLYHDYLSLKEKWLMIYQKAQQTKGISLVYQEPDIISKVVRDWLSDQVERCWVDNKEVYQQLCDSLAGVPELNERISLFQQKESLFDSFGITEELKRATREKVWLKNGAYLVIQHTEALTVIDVNTGKYTGSENLEQTVYKTNLEAAREIARQLRLRDIGGIILIDFIDMLEAEHQQAVLEQLTMYTQQDRTKTNVVGLTQLGLVEMTRRKVRASFLEMISKPCGHCEGKGYLLPEEYL